MKTSVKKQWVKIVIWITLIVVFSFIIIGIDNFILQKGYIIWISNYSDMVLEIWATQATIASLTLASTAFILGKIEDVYYGISIKDLLYLSKKYSSIGLSFWEKNICSIIMPAITLVFVVIDNIAAVVFLFMFTVYLATTILCDCISVITKSEIYSNWAKELIDNIVEKVISQNDKTTQKQKEEAKKQLSEIIDGIQKEISLEINKKTTLRENDTYCYFIRLMDRYSDESMVQINAQMHDILIDWLLLSINVKSEPNIRTILRCSYPDSLTSRWGTTGINVFMYSYYKGDISNSLFENEIENISKDILQAFDDYSAKALYVIRNAVIYADQETFVKILKAVWRSNPYNNPQIRSNVIITSMAYLYYMAYKEQYMPIEKGSIYIEKLRSFLDATFLETYSNTQPKKIKDILSNVDLFLDGVDFLLRFFNDRGFNWEFISLGAAKSARLGKDTIEFLTFYLYLFLKQVNTDNFESIPLDVLLKMKTYFNEDGSIKNEHSKEYSTFCIWLDKSTETLQKNDEFYLSIIEAIKRKMFTEAKTIRDSKKVWNNKINIMKDEMIENLSKSKFYINGSPLKDSYIMFKFSDFRFLKDFSENYACFGNEESLQSQVGHFLFTKMRQHSMLDSCPVHIQYKYFENDILYFCEMLKQMSKNKIYINEFYNHPFFNNFSYREKSKEVLEKMNIINATMKYAGKWHTCYSGVSMFVDSAIANVGFWILKNDFIKVTEELTESELKYVCQKYKTESGFMFKECSNSIEIPFSEEELLEYLKVAMVKIRYVLPVQLPRRRIGFYTYVTN